MYEEFTSITEEQAKTFIENLRTEKIHDVMVERVGDGTVLDVGCANGYVADRYTSQQYAGIDISEELIKHAKKRHPDYLFLAGEAKDILNSIDNHYDFIICKSVMEHQPNLEVAVELFKLMTEHCDTLLIGWAMKPGKKTQIMRPKGHFGKTIYQNFFPEAAFQLPGVRIKKEILHKFELWTVTKHIT